MLERWEKKLIYEGRKGVDGLAAREKNSRSNSEGERRYVMNINRSRQKFHTKKLEEQRKSNEGRDEGARLNRSEC